MTRENQRANDNDRYVLAAQPGQVAGAAKRDKPARKAHRPNGLPDCVLPESPCPGHPTVRSEPDSNPLRTIFMPRQATAAWHRLLFLYREVSPDALQIPPLVVEIRA